MATSTIGIFKTNIELYNVFRFIRNNFDKNATIKHYDNYDEENKSYYIEFNYHNENRSLHFYMNSEDYKELTKYNENINLISLSNNGCAFEVIKTIVIYFGGWYIKDDGYDDIEFYEFTGYENIEGEVLNKKLYELTEDEKDWNIRFEIISFINKNYKKIKKLKLF